MSAPLFASFGEALTDFVRQEGDTWRSVPYPDAVPVFLGAAVSLPEQHAIIAGGPGGLLRVIGTQADKASASAR